MPRVTCANRLLRLYDVLHIVKLCRVNVVLPFLVGIFLVIVPNGQEVLLRVETEDSVFRLVIFGFMLLSWPFTVWYWARVVLSFQYADWPPRKTAEEDSNAELLEEYLRRRRWILGWQLLMPRLCGIFAILMLLWAVSLESETVQRQAGWHGWLIWFVIGSFFFFVLVVWSRRDLMTRVKRKALAYFGPTPDNEEAEPRLLRPLMFSYRGSKTPHAEFYRTWRELPWITVVLLGLSLVTFSFLPFLLFRNAGLAVWSAPKLGSATILMLAASGWTCFGAWVMYLGNQYRLPIFLLAFLWVVAVSVGNDNHNVKALEDVWTPKSPDFDQHVRQWLNGRLENRRPPDEAIPVVLVTAEGGGIRAAYWTASVLTRLEEVYPGFASHIFAISSASGGSLGAAVFDALLAKPNVAPSDQCKAKVKEAKQAPDETRVLDCVRSMLQEDFVAPAFAMMLYPDLTQRFVWFPVHAWDRATALETGWEQAWRGWFTSTNNRFSEPFDRLWHGDNQYRVPGLVLNSTSVEDGKRVLFSNIPISSNRTACLANVKPSDYPPFYDVLDLRFVLNPTLCNAVNGRAKDPWLDTTLTLSGAVHNSARFSFVSPPGTVSPNLHLVDGGYFDNSGATTAMELLDGIERLNSKERTNLMPIVIHIASASQPREVTGRVAAIIPGRELRIREEQAAASTHPPSVVKVDLVRLRHPVQLRIAKELAIGDLVTVLLDRNNNVIDFKGTAGSYKTRYLSELVAPLVTLYHTWSGRSDTALGDLRRKMQAPGCKPAPGGVGNQCSKRFFEFRLIAGEDNMPVGWTLSKSSWTEMDQQLEDQFLPRCHKANERDNPYDFLLRCWPDPIRSE